jgi:transcriptional regulator with XRE-family HTH domain
MIVVNDEFKTGVGKRLRKLREGQELTINEVVERLSNNYFLDVDEKSIRRYEKGKFLPKIDNLICLAELYDTTLDYIVYGKETSDDNSFTWYDNFKRLNRLLYTMQVQMLRDGEKVSDVYLKLLDGEAKEWFSRIERFIESKRLMATRNERGEITGVMELDALFEDFAKDHTQLLPIEERMRRAFLAALPLATSSVKEENGETIVTTKIKKQ